jgi:alcohol dehydrogenase, propanol-preferring
VRGHLTIVGLGGGALPVNFSSPPYECSVASPYWGFIGELMEVVSLAQAGRIQMLVEHFPLERAGEAYRLLREGKIQGRAVTNPERVSAVSLTRSWPPPDRGLLVRLSAADSRPQCLLARQGVR